MNEKLLTYTADLIALSQENGLDLVDEQEINYGVQLKFAKDDKTILVNIYHSAKKGISTVIGGSQVNPLKPILQRILCKKIDDIKLDHDWSAWAGTDESGKGDFFGPLVVCGFICRKAMIPTLQKLQIQDSKKLKDEQIKKIAKVLYSKFNPQIETIVLWPQKYNELYGNFRDQNKKLNEMLAWMHGRVILNLNKKHEFQGAVVDKFASDHTLVSSLKELNEVKLKHHVKAEQDIAVASASIIARYLFIKYLDKLREKYQIDFPKGASIKVIEVAQAYADKFGKSRLSEVAKIHFKTFDKIKDKE